MIRLTKDDRYTIQVISAMVMLFAGLAFGVAGFIADPFGEIHDSVLWIAAQCFIYAGSAMGIAVYVKGELNGLKREIRRGNVKYDDDGEQD